jgi:SsrA-binding protein
LVAVARAPWDNGPSMARKPTGEDLRAARSPTLGNPKARHKYDVVETYECGIVLLGPEVKSLRGGRGSIEEAYGRIRGDAVWLVGMHIDEYRSRGYAAHEPLRPRKLLLHKHEIFVLRREVERRGFTLVPLKLYWGPRGHAKIQLGLVRGRKLHDKRQVEKERSAKREIERATRRR